MPPVRPERARALLPRVDPAKLLRGRPIGLRDGALLALLAAGLNAKEICGLQASAITMVRGSLLVTVRRHGVTWRAMLPPDLGARLLAWLTDRRLWADSRLVFTSRQGKLLPTTIHQILYRYQKRNRARR
jgi:site-specific recombinase XerC